MRADEDGFWFNLVDNNTTDPDATDGSARNWIPLNADWNAESGPGAILITPANPAAQVNSDWNATEGVAQSLNKPEIPDISGLVPKTSVGVAMVSRGLMRMPGYRKLNCQSVRGRVSLWSSMQVAGCLRLTAACLPESMSADDFSRSPSIRSYHNP